MSYDRNGYGKLSPEDYERMERIGRAAYRPKLQRVAPEWTGEHYLGLAVVLGLLGLGLVAYVLWPVLF